MPASAFHLILSQHPVGINGFGRNLKVRGILYNLCLKSTRNVDDVFPNASYRNKGIAFITICQINFDSYRPDLRGAVAQLV
jgi:hypothetical protein